LRRPEEGYVTHRSPGRSFAFFPSLIFAASFPSRPITMLAAVMEKTLKQPIVAVNRTGAGGALGIRAHGPVVDLDLPGGRPGQRQAALVRDEGLRAEFKNAMEKVSRQ
jgi:hypothetical protein